MAIKNFKKIVEDEGKLIVFDPSNNGGGGGGGSGLQNQDIGFPNFGLSADLKTINVYPPLNYINEGQAYYDLPGSIPPLPNEALGEFDAVYFGVYAYNNGSTVVYGLVQTPVFNVGTITVPLLLAAFPAGSTPLFAFGLLNPTTSTLTTGIDGFAEGMETFMFPLGGTTLDASKAPIIRFNSGSFESTYPIRLSAVGGIGNFSYVDDGYMDGTVVPDGADVQAVVAYIDHEYFIVPRGATQVQKVFAIVNIENSSGSDWTRGTDSFNLIDMYINNFAEFLGDYIDETEFNNYNLVASEGNTAFFGGVYHYYYANAWVAVGGGGGKNTFVGVSAFDFTKLGESYTLVKRSTGGDIIPLGSVYDPISYLTNAVIPTQVDLAQIEIDPQTTFWASVLATGVIITGIVKKDINTGKWNNPIGTYSSLAGTADLDYPIFVSKVWHDLAAVSYVNTAGDGMIALVRLAENQIQEIVWEEQILATDCEKIQVFVGNGIGNDVTKDSIVFVLSDTNSATLKIGLVSVDDNRQFQGVTINTITDGITPLANTQNFDVDGCGFNGFPTGAMVLYQGTDLEQYYVSIPTGAIQGSSNSFLGVVAASMKIKNADNDSRRGIAYTLADGSVYWSIAYWDGIGVSNFSPLSVLAADAERIILPYTIDINVLVEGDCALINTVTYDGSSTRIENMLMKITSQIPSATVLDSSAIALDQHLTFRRISVEKYRMEFITNNYSQILHSFMYLNVGGILSNYEVATGYNAVDLGYRMISAGLIANPILSEAIGIIVTSGATMGNNATVYCKGSHINGWIVTPGIVYYPTVGGQAFSTYYSPLRAGTFTDTGFLVELGTTVPQQYVANQYVFIPVPPSTVYMNAPLELQNHTPSSRIEPITFVAQNNAVPITIDGYEGTGFTGKTDPMLLSSQIYVPFGVKGDIITLQQSNDVAWRYWKVVNLDGLGKTVQYDITNAILYSTPNLTIPYQYANATNFDIAIPADIDVSTIKGFAIGHIFTINVQAVTTERIRFAIEPKATAVNGEIIDGAAGHIDIHNGDNITFQVREEYVVEVIGVNKYV